MATSKDSNSRWHKMLAEMDNEFRYDVLLNESDRGAVLIAAAFVEEALEHLLRRVLTAISPNASEPGFPGAIDRLVHGAPFARRIELCFALGLLNVRQHEAVSNLKSLRNAFAHRDSKHGRPKLTLEAATGILSAFGKPGVWDVRFVGLLPNDVDFDSQVLPMGTPRLGFALAVWLLLRSVRTAADSWTAEGGCDRTLRSIPDYDGPTFRDRSP